MSEGEMAFFVLWFFFTIGIAGFIVCDILARRNH